MRIVIGTDTHLGGRGRNRRIIIATPPEGHVRYLQTIAAIPQGGPVRQIRVLPQEETGRTLLKVAATFLITGAPLDDRRRHHASILPQRKGTTLVTHFRLPKVLLVPLVSYLLRLGNVERRNRPTTPSTKPV